MADLAIMEFENAMTVQEPNNATKRVRVSARQARKGFNGLGTFPEYIGNSKIGDDVKAPRRKITRRQLLDARKRIGVGHALISFR